MSNTSLILDGENAEAAIEQLLNEVVLLIVHGGAAERRNRGEMIQDNSIALLDEVGVAGLLDALGDAVHDPVEGPLFPTLREGSAIQRFGDAVRIGRELKGV